MEWISHSLIAQFVMAKELSEIKKRAKTALVLDVKDTGKSPIDILHS